MARHSMLALSTTPVNSSHRHRKSYRPLILRFPSLVSIFVVTLVLIALIEYGTQSLPQRSRSRTYKNMESSIRARRAQAAHDHADPQLSIATANSSDAGESRLLLRRANETVASPPSAGALTTTFITVAIPPSSNPVTAYPVSSAQVLSSPGPGLTSPVASAPGGQEASQVQTIPGEIGSTLSQTLPSTVAGPTIPVISPISLTSIEVTVWTDVTGGRHTVWIFETPPADSSPSSTDGTQPTSSTHVAPSSTHTSSAFQITTTSLVPSTSATTTRPSPVSTSSSTVTSKEQHTSVSTESSSSTLVESASSSITSSTPYGSVVTTSIQTVTDPSSGRLVLTITSTYPAYSIATGPAEGSGNKPYVVGDSASFEEIWPWDKRFIAGYLPLFIAILYRQVWSSVLASVKLMEPFSQLTGPDGALAKDTLHTYYLSSSLIPDVVLGVLKRHWIIVITSTAHLFAFVIPPLASESIYPDTNYVCLSPGRDPGTNPDNPCFPPRMTVDPVITRVLEACLAAIAILTLAMGIMLYKRTNGVVTDPSSIATVASLLHHPEVVDDFRRLDSEATTRDMIKSLGSKRYRLREYVADDGCLRYGLVPVKPDGAWWSRRIYWTYESGYGPVDNPIMGNGKRPWDIARLVIDIIFGLFIVGILGVVVAYLVVKGDSGFNVFFNSQKFGPRFFLTAVASVLAAWWRTLERECYTLAPFTQLAKSNAHSSRTILLTKPTLSLASVVSMIYRNYPFVAFIAFIAFLAEVAVVFVVGIPFHSAQTDREFAICAYLSVTILAFMIVGAVSLVFWRRRLPHLPRRPDTVGGLMSYLCASRMLDDFDGTEWVGRKERDRRIRSMGKRYEYAKKRANDGFVRWRIDEGEPL